MKKIIYLLSIFMTIYLIVNPGMSFAENENKCPAQTATPQDLENYLQNVQDILNTIQVTPAQQNQNQQPAQASENYDWAISRAADRATSAAKWVKDRVENTINDALPFADWEITDFYVNFKILQNSDVVIRDWNKILALDKHISKKATDIGVKWTNQELIPANDIWRINNMLIKFDFFTQKPQIPTQSVKKSELVWLMFQINMFYKKMYLEATKTSHNWDDLTILDKYFKENVDRFHMWWYDTTHIQKLVTAYTNCAWIEMTFWEFMTKFNSWVDSIVEMWNWWFNTTWNSMKSSYSDLKCFMFGNCAWWMSQSNRLSDRQNTLLTNQWIDPTKWGASNMFGLANAWDKVKEWANLDALRWLNFDKFTNLFTMPKVEEKAQPITQSVERRRFVDNYKDVMKTSFNNILANQESNSADITMEKPDFLKKLPQLSKKVYKWISVVWDPSDSNKDTVWGNFAWRCEKQATNASPTCKP